MISKLWFLHAHPMIIYCQRFFRISDNVLFLFTKIDIFRIAFLLFFYSYWNKYVTVVINFISSNYFNLTHAYFVSKFSYIVCIYLSFFFIYIMIKESKIYFYYKIIQKNFVLFSFRFGSWSTIFLIFISIIELVVQRVIVVSIIVSSRRVSFPWDT